MPESRLQRTREAYPPKFVMSPEVQAIVDRYVSSQMDAHLSMAQKVKGEFSPSSKSGDVVRLKERL